MGRCTGGSSGTPGNSIIAYGTTGWHCESGTAVAVTGGPNLTVEQDGGFWSVSIAASGSNVEITVQGALNMNLTWHSFVTVRPLSS